LVVTVSRDNPKPENVGGALSRNMSAELFDEEAQENANSKTGLVLESGV
jgi:hypothetical protein